MISAGFSCSFPPGGEDPSDGQPSSPFYTWQDELAALKLFVHLVLQQGSSAAHFIEGLEAIALFSSALSSFTGRIPVPFSTSSDSADLERYLLETMNEIYLSAFPHLRPPHNWN